MNNNQSMYQYLLRSGFDERRTAIKFEHKRISYKKLMQEVDSIAGAFFRLGLQKGDSVTIALPNIPSTVSLVYACSKSGIVANMVHPLVPCRQLVDYAKMTSSKLIFAMDQVIKPYYDELLESKIKIIVCRAQDYLNAIETVVYNVYLGGLKYKIDLKQDSQYFSEFRECDILTANVGLGDDVITVMHSGGTTSTPKSICLTNTNYNAVSTNTISVIAGNSKHGSMLTILPMFHAFGLGVCVHTALSNQINAYLVSRYLPKRVMRILMRHRINYIAGVPTLYRSMVDQPKIRFANLHPVRFAFCGGDKLDSYTKEKFDKLFEQKGSLCKLDEGYGLTEVSGVFSVNTRKDNRVGSCGKALDGYLIEAFDNDNALCKRGTMGQLCISAQTVMKGYLNDDKATRETFFDFDGKRWLKTGDFGMVDADGFIFFKQRIKRIIKVSGVPVFPSEVEDTLSKIDGVKLACVIGVENISKGMVLHAYIVKASDVDEQQLRAVIKKHCEDKLDKWSRPRELFFVDNLPMTMHGKVDYKKLEDELKSVK